LAERLVAAEGGAGQHGGDGLVRRRDDGQAVGPAALEIRFDQLRGVEVVVGHDRASIPHRPCPADRMAIAGSREGAKIPGLARASCAGHHIPRERESRMSDQRRSRVTRRGFLQSGAALITSPILAAAGAAVAQGPAKATKVLDFSTGADVAKAEQEGEVVYYGHDGEAGSAAPLDRLRHDFPKIKTKHGRLQK